MLSRFNLIFAPPLALRTDLLERLEVGLEQLVFVARVLEERHGLLRIALRLRVLTRQLRQLRREAIAVRHPRVQQGASNGMWENKKRRWIKEMVKMDGWWHRAASLLLLLLHVSGSAGFCPVLQLPALGGTRARILRAPAARRRDLPNLVPTARRRVLAPTMGAWEVVNAFPWALIPGTVAAAILAREGGFSAIGVFIDETFDYLEEKGGYIITEVRCPAAGLRAQRPKNAPRAAFSPACRHDAFAKLTDGMLLMRCRSSSRALQERALPRQTS